MMSEQNRCYAIWVDDEYEGGCVYVETSLERAKMAAEEELQSRYPENKTALEGAELDIDVSDLERGLLDNLEGVKRGAYKYADANCPICGKLGDVSISLDFGEVMCSDCEEARLDKEFPLCGTGKVKKERSGG